MLAVWQHLVSEVTKLIIFLIQEKKQLSFHKASILKILIKKSGNNFQNTNMSLQTTPMMNQCI